MMVRTPYSILHTCAYYSKVTVIESPLERRFDLTISLLCQLTENLIGVESHLLTHRNGEEISAPHPSSSMNEHRASLLVKIIGK